MKQATHQTSSCSSPTIFFHDTDDQVLTWLQHAQSMTKVQGRWQNVWEVFESEARQECTRRKLQVKPS